MTYKYDRLFFDIETDGLQEDLTTIHMIAIGKPSGKIVVFEDIDKAVKILSSARELVGHNIIGFDIPVIQQFYPEFTPNKIYDTLIASNLMHTDIYTLDNNLKNIPPEFRGKYSLESWGYRLGVYKGDFGKQTTWELTEENKEEMKEYNKQDVKVTMALWQHIEQSGRVPEGARELEQDVKRIINRQEKHGFLFDREKAEKLLGVLYDELEEVSKKLQEAFPPKEVIRGYYKRPNKNKGIKKGDPKISVIEFNPGSRDQIAERLMEKYDWKPKVTTPTGKPKINESILGTLDFPEAKILNRYLLIDNRIGQLAEGNGSILKSLQEDGRIRGRVNTLGTVSRRMSHYSPNVAQVPSNHSPYGEEFRSMFIVPEGYKLVGCDADQLELRVLAHYMAHWDKGEYAKEFEDENGDVHTKNQEAAGLPTRDAAKTFIYTFVFGGGNKTIGKRLGGDEKLGKKVRSEFLKNMPSLKNLVSAASNKADKTNEIRTLDGVPISVSASYIATNRIIQSAGAIIMKRGLVILDENLQETLKLTPGTDYEFVGNIHDEWQIEVKEEFAEVVGKAAEEAIRDAGRYYNLRCLMSGSAAIGDSWKETH